MRFVNNCEQHRVGIEDRLDDAIYVLRNHAEAGFLPQTGVVGDAQMPIFVTSSASIPTGAVTGSSLYSSGPLSSIGSSSTQVSSSSVCQSFFCTLKSVVLNQLVSFVHYLFTDSYLNCDML